MFNRSLAMTAAMTLLCSIGALLALSVAARNYRTARDLFAPAAPSPLLQNPDRAGVANLQAISFESPDGVRLAGWYVTSKNHAAVVVTHGTNDDRVSMLAELRLLAEAGFGVLAFDWPGLGESAGPIRWDAGARRALTAAIDWLSRRSDVDPHQIGGLGFSMGGAMMTQVAAGDQRLRAIVLEGTPTTFDAYIEFHNGRWGVLGTIPARWALRGSGLLSGEFAPQRLIGAVSPRPLLIIGGTEDGEIPAAMVRELYASAREPKSLWIVPHAGHGGYAQVAPIEYRRRLLAFFSSNLTRAARENSAK